MPRERCVLVVHPPFICPAAPPHAPALAAARLRGAGAFVSVYNANQDFLLNYLLDTGFMRDCLEMVRSKPVRDIYQRLSDSLLLDQLDDINKNHEQWQDRCERARDIPRVMCGDGFYDPAKMVWARGEFDAILALASLAFFPLRLHWNGLHHPEVQSWETAWAFSRQSFNPFYSLAKRLREFCRNTQSLVFCIQCQDQLLPGLSLFEALKKERPECRAVFWGPGLNVLNPPQGITWLCGHEPADLCAALEMQDAGPQPPDYKGLDNCLAPESVPGCIRFYEMEPAPTLDALKTDKASGVVAAAWRVGREADLAELAKALGAASKAGLWNRVELAEGAGPELSAWCAANPNLAHSVIAMRRPGSGFCGPPPLPMPAEPMAGPLPPMPGRPLWRWLDQDAHLVLYVRHHGVGKTRTYRVRKDNTAYRMAKDLEYRFVHYPDLDQGQVNDILELISSAGRVKPDWLKHNLERAFLIAYALDQGVLVGTETLKHPRPEYIHKVRERTGLDFTRHLERGYIVVRPEYRGLGVADQLVKGCLARAPGYKTFLVIAADNVKAQQLTSRHGSRFLTGYYSREMGAEIQIWTPKDQDDLPVVCEEKCS